jgi:hypothetical protein
LILATLAAVTGCGRESSVEPPDGADELVLRLAELPGLLPVTGAAGVFPTFSLYGDGHLISSAGRGTGWPDLRDHQVSRDEVKRLLGAATDAGLLGDAPPPAGPDAPMVIVTAVSAGQRRTSTRPQSDPALTPIRADLNGHIAGPGSAYQPQAVAVIAISNEAPGPTRPWTLSELEGQLLRSGGFCTVLRGPDVDAARRLADGSDVTTIWTHGDRRWSLAFRPLLPDEPDCAAL